jgi:hypothetical protein
MSDPGNSESTQVTTRTTTLAMRKKSMRLIGELSRLPFSAVWIEKAAWAIGKTQALARLPG